MSLTLINPPANEPISVSEIKDHLRILNDDNNDDLSGLGVSARHALEARSGFAFLPQVWAYQTERQGQTDIVLPITPVLEINALEIVHDDGSLEAIDRDHFRVELGSVSRIRLNQYSLASQVVNFSPRDHIKITFTAGHRSIGDIPPELRHAIRILIAHFYENRESASQSRVYSIPRSIDALLAPYRKVTL